MVSSLGGKGVGGHRQREDELRGGPAAVEPKVEGDLVIAGAARMQVGAGGCQLSQAALDRRVDVFVSVSELECATVQLALDLPKPALDGGQPRFRQQACTRERAGVREAAGDVDRVKLEVGFQR